MGLGLIEPLIFSTQSTRRRHKGHKEVKRETRNPLTFLCLPLCTLCLLCVLCVEKMRASEEHISNNGQQKEDADSTIDSEEGGIYSAQVVGIHDGMFIDEKESN